MKKVRIYGTLGPACADEKTLEAMLLEGMDGVRLNLSHMTLIEASGLIGALHGAGRACGKTPELMIDMQGPELRLGALDAPVRLAAGEVIPLAALPFPAAVLAAFRTAPAGQELLLDDGKLLLSLTAPDRLTVVRGGLLESRKSVALPGIDVDTPAVTEADRRNILRIGEYGVTSVMQPFVRSGADLVEVRQELIKAGCGGVRLLAKIENAEGLASLESIIPHCDEIVIARGDLGNAMPLWELPAAQKRIAKACREAGRDFMVVTQMLDSMTHRAVPTRAEVSDIFNAVLDGASSVMVTGETASGEYPVEAVRYLARTAREAEKYLEAL